MTETTPEKKTEKTTELTFKQAHDAVKKGKTVKRAVWTKFVISDGQCHFHNGYVKAYAPTEEDQKAKDWMIIQ